MNEREARRIVRARSVGVCELCGVNAATSWSHRRSRGQGGPWRPANGLDVCGSGTELCHGWLEANPALAAAGGWRLVHDDRDPELVYCYLRPRQAWPGWWRLDDDGNLRHGAHEAALWDREPPTLPPWALR